MCNCSVAGCHKLFAFIFVFRGVFKDAVGTVSSDWMIVMSWMIMDSELDHSGL